MLVLKSLQSNQVAPRRSTKRVADESNEASKRNTMSSTGVSSSVTHTSVDRVKPADHLPASIRNIHRLSALDNEMTNGGRFVKQNY